MTLQGAEASMFQNTSKNEECSLAENSMNASLVT